MEWGGRVGDPPIDDVRIHDRRCQSPLEEAHVPAQGPVIKSIVRAELIEHVHGSHVVPVEGEGHGTGHTPIVTPIAQPTMNRPDFQHWKASGQYVGRFLVHPYRPPQVALLEYPVGPAVAVRKHDLVSWELHATRVERSTYVGIRIKKGPD